MGENSKIEWTDHTFNPWVGCTKISPACDFCYAEMWAKRAGEPELWKGERRLTSDANWAQPLKWDRQAREEGVRKRVFCASLADVFDNQVPQEWRDKLWALIVATPHLDWLLLTKRPQNIPAMYPALWQQPGRTPPNVWLGTTVENKLERRRIDHLRAVPAVVRFLSIEPLLEDLDQLDLTGIHSVFVGGESGHGARPTHPDWARSIRNQCVAAGVAFLFKQWGDWVPVPEWLVGVSYLQTAIKRDGSPVDDDVAPEDVGGQRLARVGKKIAGRLLDGVEHNDMPGGAR